jgi:hypothetical protein
VNNWAVFGRALDVGSSGVGGSINRTKNGEKWYQQKYFDLIY